MICFHDEFTIRIRFHEGHRAFVAVADYDARSPEEENVTL